MQSEDVGLLAGVRVLDLTDETGSPGVAVLAGFGAEVLKVEPPGGSRERSFGPFAGDLPDPNASLRFWYYNPGQHGLRLDLDKPAGRETLHDLAAEADILVETFPPGYLAQRGAGYDDLRSRNPGLIYLSLTPFGQSGPWREYQTTDLVAWMLGGPGSLCGLPDRPPLRPAGLQSFNIAGSYLAIAALAALHRRERTGRGEAVDVSIHEAVTSLAESAVFFWQGERRIMPRFGSQHPTTVPIDVYRTADGYAYLNCLSAGQWQALLRWLAESEELGELADPQYDDVRARIRDRDRIEARLHAFLARQSRHEVFRRGQTAAIPAAFLARLDEVVSDPHLTAREFFQPFDVPGQPKPLQYPGPPVRPRVGGRVRPTAPGADGGGWKSWRREGAPEAGPTSAGATSARPPLAGVRVLDLTWVWAGPFATAILAELGADVIKVEPPAGDINRLLPAFAEGRPGTNRGIPFAAYNRNKRSVCLDARTPAGRALLLDLARHADVVVENFSAGTLERLGLDYPALAAANPRVIVARLAGFGQTGPYVNDVSYAPTLHALAGLTAISGYPDGYPIGTAIALGDFQGGLYGVVAILAALRYRDRTGPGQEIDLAQFEVVASLIGPALLDYRVNGRTGELSGNRLTEQVNGPHGVYPTRGDDRWIAIAVTSDEAWERFCHLLGNPAWTRDARFSTGSGRQQYAEALDQLVAAWTCDQDGYDLMTTLQKAGIPAGVVQDGRDLLEHDPQLAAREFFVPVDHPEIGPLGVARNPMLYSESAPVVQHAGPLLGEHTLEALREVLGLGEPEIEWLIEAGAIRPAPAE